MRRTSKSQLAQEVWGELLGYFFAHKEVHGSVLQELGLTPGHMKTLFVLDLDEPHAMGELADMLACDASNATWLVDRLEERGLVERRPHARDRRVKTVVLTEDGAKLKVSLIQGMAEPPTDLVALEREDLETLRAALRLLPEHPAFWETTAPTGECGDGAPTS
jgi:DNA-binding MarR family transcriptional regulator